MMAKIKPLYILYLITVFVLLTGGQAENPDNEDDALEELNDMESSLETEDPQAGGSIRDKAEPKILRRETNKTNIIRKGKIQKDN